MRRPPVGALAAHASPRRPRVDASCGHEALAREPLARCARIAPLASERPVGEHCVRDAVRERRRRDVVVDEHAGHAVDDGFAARRRGRRATTGVPHACASTGTMPKSSIAGQKHGARLRDRDRESFVGCASRGTRRSGPAIARRRACSGSAPDDFQRHADASGRPRWRRRAACRARGPTRSGSWVELGGWRLAACRSQYLQEDTQWSTRDYSIGGSCPQHIESSRESGPRAPPSRHPTGPAAPSPAGGARLAATPTWSGPKYASN